MTLDELEQLIGEAELGRLASDDGRNIFDGRVCVATRGRSSTDEEVEDRSMAAMRLLAAAVNALPALLRVARAAEAYIATPDCGEEWEARAGEFAASVAALRKAQR
jgi:hypothetical protein